MQKSGKRVPIPGPRQIGTVADWKGAFGWIQPSKAIKHPNAHKHAGKVYLAAEDVSEELDGIGASVSFTLYSDGNGLGASDCKMSKAAAPAAKPVPQQKQPHRPATSNAVAAYKAANSPAAKAAALAKAKAGAAARLKAVQQTAFQKKTQAAQAGKSGGQAAKGGGGKAAGGKGGGGKGGADTGKREILHDEPLMGTIVDWRGKFGWVKPHDTIEHPMAHKHKGDLFLAQEDVEAEIEGVGSVVQFMLYGDSRGLGAANVTPA